MKRSGIKIAIAHGIWLGEHGGTGACDRLENEVIYPRNDVRRSTIDSGLVDFTLSQLETKHSVMFTLNLAGNWEERLQQARALVAGETDPVANAANLSALLFNLLDDVNWAGFYFLRDQELVVGPFQGQPACVRIPVGKGVCGTAALRRETIVVDDVEAFPGHIACDAASRSEIVIPLLDGDRLLGVLDLDSPRLARFGAADRAALESVANIWVESVTASGAGSRV